MKTTQIRTEQGRSSRPDGSAQRPAGGEYQITTNIDDVLRQIVREELAARYEE
jgi:hypothetical protein